MKCAVSDAPFSSGLEFLSQRTEVQSRIFGVRSGHRQLLDHQDLRDPVPGCGDGAGVE